MFWPTVTWQTDFDITIAQHVVFDRSLAWVVLIRLKTLSNGGFKVCLLLWQLECFVPLLYDVTIGQFVVSDRSLACVIFISLRALSNGEAKSVYSCSNCNVLSHCYMTVPASGSGPAGSGGRPVTGVHESALLWLLLHTECRCISQWQSTSQPPMATPASPAPCITWTPTIPTSMLLPFRLLVKSSKTMTGKEALTSSLHYTKPCHFNQYAAAIQAVGEIIRDYDR